MPFKSKSQKKLVLAAAHNVDFAKKVGFPKEDAIKFAEDAGVPIEKSKKPRFSKIMKKIKGANNV
jgi:hypothetical protein